MISLLGGGQDCISTLFLYRLDFYGNVHRKVYSKLESLRDVLYVITRFNLNQYIFCRTVTVNKINTFNQMNLQQIQIQGQETMSGQF